MAISPVPLDPLTAMSKGQGKWGMEKLSENYGRATVLPILWLPQRKG